MLGSRTQHRDENFRLGLRASPSVLSAAELGPLQTAEQPSPVKAALTGRKEVKELCAWAFSGETRLTPRMKGEMTADHEAEPLPRYTILGLNRTNRQTMSLQTLETPQGLARRYWSPVSIRTSPGSSGLWVLQIVPAACCPRALSPADT